MAFHKNQLDRRADDMPLNDTALYHLLNVGVRDMDAIDKPWDASTRSMRYAACLCQGHSSLDAPSELNPPQRIPSPLFVALLVPQAEG